MRHLTRSALAAAILALVATIEPRAGFGDDAASHAFSVPDSRLGLRTAPLLLLSRPDIRADLGLDARQTAEADRAIAELYNRAAALRGKNGPEAIDARKAIDEGMQRWIDDNLSEPQRIRLIQIDLQWEGPSALISRPIVADTLFLTREQRLALTQAVVEYRRKRSTGPYNPDDERQLAKVAYDVLSEEQRLRFNEMRGPRFQLAKPIASKPNERTAR
jgi:hypothetical protein